MRKGTFQRGLRHDLYTFTGNLILDLKAFYLRCEMSFFAVDNTRIGFVLRVDKAALLEISFHIVHTVRIARRIFSKPTERY